MPSHNICDARNKPQLCGDSCRGFLFLPVGVIQLLTYFFDSSPRNLFLARLESVVLMRGTGTSCAGL